MSDPTDKRFSTALLCGKWELAFYVPVRSGMAETAKPKTQRSYLYHVAAHQPLVAAKCVATEWLLRDFKSWDKGAPRQRRVREYFGGVGIMTTIIRGLYPELAEHTVSERDGLCLRQLHAIFPLESGVKVRSEDARRALLEPRNAGYNLQVLDFPAFTALQLAKRWQPQLEALFRGKPEAVVITDTAASYLGAHKKTYAHYFGASVNSPSDYTRVFSDWLHKRYGYVIVKAAYRDKNAAYYLLAARNEGEFLSPQEKIFLAKDHENGFIWL